MIVADPAESTEKSFQTRSQVFDGGAGMPSMASTRFPYGNTTVGHMLYRPTSFMLLIAQEYKKYKIKKMPKYIGENGSVFNLESGEGGAQAVFEIPDTVARNERRMEAARKIIAGEYHTNFEKQYQIHMLVYITDEKVEELIGLIEKTDQSIMDVFQRGKNFAARMRAGMKY